MKEEWTINKREKTCSACSVAFMPGNDYMGALFQEDNEYVRKDLCLSCWEEKGTEESIFSFWKGHLPEKTDEDTEPLKSIEKVEYFLRKLVEKRNVPRKACYILAVILERKRIIKQVDIKKDSATGEKILIFEFVKTGESIVLEDPHIKLDEIPVVQAELEQIIREEEKE